MFFLQCTNIQMTEIKMIYLEILVLTSLLMLLCPTPGSSWAPIRLLLFGCIISSLFRAVHEIDKRVPRGPIIVRSECSGEGVRSSYLAYWAYFAFYIIFNIFLIFQYYKKLTGWIFWSKEQTDSHYLCVKHLHLPHLKQSLLGEKGTTPLYIADFSGASCDKSQNSGDGCRWW